jgi:predicted nucleic acid-binding protein
MSLTDDTVATLDANVLFPMPLCDTLLSLAEESLYLPRWSSQILEEVRRNLVDAGRCSAPQALRRITLMNDAFPEAMTEDYESLIPQLANSPKDRHVLAAAIRADADLIVTQNVRDFSLEALKPWQIRPVNADRFLMDLLEATPGNDERVARRILRQAGSLKRPLMTHYTVLDRLALHAPAFAHRMREIFDRGTVDLSLLRLEDL